MSSEAPLLKLGRISKHFAGLTALQNVDLEVYEGEIVGLIGPNGAGKSTLFNVISGYLRPDTGKVFFKGMDITGHRPDLICSLGLARTFQLCLLLPEMTVMDCMRVAHHLKAKKSSIWATILNLGSLKNKGQEIDRNSLALIEQFGLEKMKGELIKHLPYGYKRLLSVAMVLSTEPRMLLLDEPVAGVSAGEAEVLIKLIHEVRATRNVTFLVIEHNMRTIMGLCQRIMVLDFGRKIAEGSPEAIQANEQVIKAYLGSKKTA